MRKQEAAGEILFFWNGYWQMIRQAKKIKKRSVLDYSTIWVSANLSSQASRNSGVMCRESLRADVIALGAEDALGDIDADTFCCPGEIQWHAPGTPEGRVNIRCTIHGRMLSFPGISGAPARAG